MNWDILGHDWATRLLMEHITLNKLKHAYLFCGPHGIGRRTLALRFAQALNCSQPPATALFCGVCSNCKRITIMQHPDLAVVQSDRPGGTLKVEQVRELQHSLSLAPYEARYRIALLLRFEEANQNAANALLKTLEEPAPQVILILTAESPESLLPTISSRCEIIRLKPLSIEMTNQGLQEHFSVPSEQARLVAHLSGGRPGYGLRLSSDPDALERRKAWLDDHQSLLGQGRLERFAYAETLSKDKDSARLVLQTWLSLWRDVMLASTGAPLAVVNPDREEEIAYLSSSLGLVRSRQAVSLVERTLHLLDHNVNPRLALEVLMLDLPVVLYSSITLRNEPTSW